MITTSNFTVDGIHNLIHQLVESHKTKRHITSMSYTHTEPITEKRINHLITKLEGDDVRVTQALKSNKENRDTPPTFFDNIEDVLVPLRYTTVIINMTYMQDNQLCAEKHVYEIHALQIENVQTVANTLFENSTDEIWVTPREFRATWQSSTIWQKRSDNHIVMTITDFCTNTQKTRSTTQDITELVRYVNPSNATWLPPDWNANPTWSADLPTPPTAVIEHYGRDAISELQPILPEFTNHLIWATDAHDLTKRLFGEANHRSDLVRAVATAKIEFLALAHAIYQPGILADWIVPALQGVDVSSSRNRDSAVRKTMVLYLSDMIDTLKCIDLRTSRNLFKHIAQNHVDGTIIEMVLNHMNQCARMARWNVGVTMTPAMFTGRDFRTLELSVIAEQKRCEKERTDANNARATAAAQKLEQWYLSDNGIAYLAKKSEEEQKRLDEMRKANAERFARYDIVCDKLRNLNITSIDSTLRLVVATSVDELNTWGQLMHNCIDTYSQDLLDAHAALFAIYKGDRLVANGEINVDDESPNLVQLLASYNRSWGYSGELMSMLTDVGIDCNEAHI